jgi:hypothetical protein
LVDAQVPGFGPAHATTTDNAIFVAASTMAADDDSFGSVSKCFESDVSGSSIAWTEESSDEDLDYFAALDVAAAEPSPRVEGSEELYSIPKIQILEFSQTRSKFKMNFKFHFKMFVCELISTNKIIVVYILSKILLKISYKYFPSDHPRTLSEILPKYSTNISPHIFLLRNTFRIIFEVPTNIFFITFLILIRIRMPPVSYAKLYKLITLI